MLVFRHHHFTCMLFFWANCVACVQFVSAEDSQAQETIMDAAKIFTEMVDDVEEMLRRLEILQKAFLGKECTETAKEETRGPEPKKETNVPEPKQKTKAPEPKIYPPARITVIFRDNDEAEIRIEHGWKHVSQSSWHVNGVLEPDYKYQQTHGRGVFSITVPTTIFGQESVHFYEGLSLYVQVEDVVFMLDCVLEERNVSTDNNQAHLITKEVDISTFTVSPSKNIEYNPGEQVLLTVNGSEGNDSEMGWAFFSLNNSTITRYSSFKHAYLINTTKEFTSNRWIYTFTIDTTSLLSGGLLSLFETNAYMSGEGFKGVGLSSKQAVHLYLPGTDGPIPRNEVAIFNKYYANQKLSPRQPEMPVRCIAFGNPTPRVEFLIEGRPVYWERAHWSVDYFTSLTALVPSNATNDRITCRAESGDAVAEMIINLEYRLSVVNELTSLSRVSDTMIEATCAISGKPAPRISFYVNYISDETLLSAGDDHVEIDDSYTDKHTTISELHLDTSDRDEYWSLLCVGKSGGRQIEHYFDMLISP